MVKEHWREDGTKVHIEPGIIPDFEKILKEYDPQLIVEFGPYYGGMTKYFTEWCPESFIYSVDAFWLISKGDAEYFRNKNVTFMITSQLCEKDIAIPMLLTLPLKKFLFCDAAMRDHEIKRYAGYLNPGDLLGMHDWPDNEDKLEGAFLEFKEHEINEKFSVPGVSDLRFWWRRHYLGKIQTPNSIDEVWKPGVGKDENYERQRSK